MYLLIFIFQFYVEASEAEAWLREKKPLLTSADYGKDEDSVASLLKKLEGISREVSAFRQTVGRLGNLSHGLVNRGHFDSDNISQKQVLLLLVYIKVQIIMEGDFFLSVPILNYL